eukprot:scaffold52046_cov69-Phaeocystis_antarctica.AAC.2
MPRRSVVAPRARQRAFPAGARWGSRRPASRAALPRCRRLAAAPAGCAAPPRPASRAPPPSAARPRPRPCRPPRRPPRAPRR